ncbi:S8 family peptidase [Geobacillus stearothermophilus]|uniref:S8 family peptidase n=1 Tax=Geobacillus stearothermophilus TaxID=1422 RepID=UPI000508517B|nr:S8 family peptidase [Geobacillus stearothermophilus]MED0653303.1 S8 family peptidase [Anoxybacillus geothermalis]STO12022.1 Thermophilic serine proteinase precursor [[Flavobacterium] thermophilum]KFL16674.1 peptidase S8 [Geobacillus stearothermophilus]KFX33750.1 peptidase S8 [Geobacillus stearothermophilus]MDF9296733.1 S8 family peptidase [Geobacillus stearothermophilus]
MNRRYTIWAALGAAVALVVAAVVSFTRPAPQENVPVPPRLEPFDTNDARTHPTIVALDSLNAGEQLKEQLNAHPRIREIRHNERGDRSHYFYNEIAVRFQTPPDHRHLTRMEAAIRGQLVKRLDHVFVFRSHEQTYEDMRRYFRTLPTVEYCEPNYIYMQNDLSRPVETPNDSFYARYQWNLPAIHTEAGWTLSRGKQTVPVAIIDSGVDLTHPDLIRRLGPGYNVLADDRSPNDENGHGTHVAGIIASQPNNDEGVAGITWFNPIMAVKALNADGYGTSIDVAKGIRWAVDHGAKVINLSLGNYQPSSVLEEAIRYADAHDVVLVAASGNDSTSQPSFPAAYPEVISVGAVDPDLSYALYSNYGEYIDVVAPGTNIASTFAGHQYAALSGTSMAAPHVAALAALIRSVNPRLSNDEVRSIILESADDLGERGKDPYYGYGLINVYRALELAKP